MGKKNIHSIEDVDLYTVKPLLILWNIIIYVHPHENRLKCSCSVSDDSAGRNEIMKRYSSWGNIWRSLFYLPLGFIIIPPRSAEGTSIINEIIGRIDHYLFYPPFSPIAIWPSICSWEVRAGCMRACATENNMDFDRKWGPYGSILWLVAWRGGI